MMQKNNRKRLLKRLLFWLSSPAILFWAMPYMIVLLVVGTFEQRELGLYTATQFYFSSFVFFVDIIGLKIPLPAGYLIMGLLGINLLARLVYRPDWQWPRTGIFLLHFGILLLFIGGFFTAATAREGFLFLVEGTTRDIVSDYHTREMVIADDNGILFHLNHDDLKPNMLFDYSSLPFTIRILEQYEHVEIIPVTNGMDDISDDVNIIGPAQMMSLGYKEPEPEDEANIAGLVYQIIDREDVSSISQTMMFDGFPKPIIWEKDAKKYYFALTRAKRSLPFSVRLDDFMVEYHQGTNKARGYSSAVTVKDGDISWPFLIEMNKPLRYRGYTLFQSSYDIAEDGSEASVLAVVENKGQWFPYISTFFIALGLILHCFVVLKRRKELEETEGGL